MRLKTNKNNILLLILSFTLLYTGTISAQELSLEEAIELGMENNKEIKDARESLRQIDRNFERINAQQDWQLTLGAGYDYDFTVEEGDLTGVDRNINPSISGGKTFISGFNLNPQISIDEDLETSFSMSISQSLYPQLPTELARNYYRNEKNLLKTQRDLKEVKVNSILTWLDTYLNINRMVQEQEIFNEGFTKAEDNLARVLERHAIGDAGKNEILAAELSLENAKYSLLEAENSLEDIYYVLSTELGLSVENDINIIDKNKYIAKLREKARKYTEEYLQQSTTVLIDIVEGNNNKLQANLIDSEVLQKELEWLKKEDKPNLNLSGSYGTANDDLTVGLRLSYQLYDGGQHKMDLEDKEKEVADKLKEYDDLYKQLKQELKKHLDKLELAEMALKRDELSLTRSQYELEVAEKQLEMGLIDYLEYQDKWISKAEAEIKIASLKDQLFLSRMEFIKFLDLDLADEIIGGF